MYDSMLMFWARLSLSPSIFNELSQAVRRITAIKNFSKCIDYLDDFLLIAETKEECSRQALELIKLLRYLGFSINYNKVVGPAQRITFLGVELDSNTCTISLPQDNLETFLQQVKDFNQHKKESLPAISCWQGFLGQPGNPMC